VELLPIAGLPGSPLGGLRLIPEDKVEVVFVSWTLPSGFLTLMTCWLSFIALRKQELAEVHSILLYGEFTYFDSPRSTHLAAPTGLPTVNHLEL
jgi:hypothetical protein